MLVKNTGLMADGSAPELVLGSKYPHRTESSMSVRGLVAFVCMGVSLMIGPAGAQAPGDQHAVHQPHGHPAAYIAALEDPKRDVYQKPHEVMQALGIEEGSTR
jgi:hypothetical protein